MAAERECICCKNLPLWASSGVRRTSNAGHWSGGGMGSGSYLRNWLSDGEWGPSEFHVLSTASQIITRNASETEYQLWRVDSPVQLLISPSLTVASSSIYTLFDDKLHCISPTHVAPGGSLSVIDAYCTIWNLSTNAVDMDSKKITSFTVDGSEQFPLYDESGADGTIARLNYVVTPEDNYMFLQRVVNKSGSGGDYYANVGTFAINSLSSTECQIAFTTVDSNSTALNLTGESQFIGATCKIAQASDGTVYYQDTAASVRKLVKLPGGYTYNSGSGVTATLDLAGRCGYVSAYRLNGTTYNFNVVGPDGSYAFSVTSANLATFDFSMLSTSSASALIPAMMGGRWCINGKPTLTLANSTFPDLLTAFDSDDTEPDGDVDLTKFSFNADFTEVERRGSWNWGPVEPGGRYSPGHDGFEATSPFRYLVATLPEHDSDIEDIFKDAYDLGGDPLGENWGQQAVLQQWDAGIPTISTAHELHYDLSGDTAEFEIRFIDTMINSEFGSAMVYHEVNDLTEDMILILATGTVTFDALEAADISTSDNKVWSVTVNNVSGGADGGILSLALRADKEIYGTPDDATFGYLPPRVPAVYQEFYDVPADP